MPEDHTANQSEECCFDCLQQTIVQASADNRWELVSHLLAENDSTEQSAIDCTYVALSTAASLERWALAAKVLSSNPNLTGNPALREECCIAAAKLAASSFSSGSNAKSVSYLVKLIDDPSARDQCWRMAAEGAAAVGCWQHAKSFIAAVEDPGVRDLCRIQVAIASGGRVPLVTELCAGLSDASLADVCRAQAAEAAAKLNDSSSVYNVVQLLRNVADISLRQQSATKAAEILASRGQPKPFHRLLREIIDSDERERCLRLAATSAATRGYWELSLATVQAIKHQTVRYGACLKTAVAGAHQGRLEPTIQLIDILHDEQMRNKCRGAAVKSASAKGHLDVVSYMAAGITDIEYKGKCVAKSMCVAAKGGHQNIVTHLLTLISPTGNKTQWREGLIKSLEAAADSGQYDVAIRILEAFDDDDVKSLDENCARAATAAALAGHWQVAAELGRRIIDQACRDRIYGTAAESAAAAGSSASVADILSRVAQLDAKNNACVRSMLAAASKEHWQLAEDLLEKLTEDYTISLDCAKQMASLTISSPGHLNLLQALLWILPDPEHRHACCIEAAAVIGAIGDSKALPNLIQISQRFADQLEDSENRKNILYTAAVESAARSNQGQFAARTAHLIWDQFKITQCCIGAAQLAAQFNHQEAVLCLIACVADQTGKDECYRKAAVAAVTKANRQDDDMADRLGFAVRLLSRICDQKQRNECCLAISESAGKVASQEILTRLVKMITETNIRDKFRVRAIESATAASRHELATRLLQTIVDKRTRAKCHEWLIRQAIDGKRLQHVVPLLVTMPDNSKSKEQYCLEAGSLAGLLNQQQLATSILSLISSQRCQVEYCIRVAEAAASCGLVTIVNYFLSRRTTELLEAAGKLRIDQCCCVALKNIDFSQNPGGDDLEAVIDCLCCRVISEQQFRAQWQAGAAVAAASRGSPKEAVLARLALLTDEVERQQWHRKAIECAAKNGHLELVAQLAHTSLEAEFRRKCCEGLEEAAGRAGSPSVLTQLLEAFDADLSARDQFCSGTVRSAINHSRLDIVIHLLPSISDPGVRDQSCIQAASLVGSQADNIESVEALLMQISDTKLKNTFCAKVAELLVVKGDEKLVIHVVNSVAHETERDKCRQTIANCALFHGHMELACLLIVSIADKALREECCLEAADHLGSRGQMEALRKLAAEVSLPNLRNKYFDKAIRSAACNGQLEALVQLESAIDDEAIKTRALHKAARLAANNGHTEIVLQLEKHIKQDNRLHVECCQELCKLATESGEWSKVVRLAAAIANQTQREQCLKDIVRMTASKNSLINFASDVLPEIGEGSLKQLCCTEVALAAVANQQLSIFETIDASISLLLKDNGTLAYLADYAIKGEQSTIDSMLSRSKETHLAGQLLSRSILAGFPALAEALLPAVADIDRADEDGTTAVMLAADEGYRRLIIKLLGRGASKILRDRQGRTALTRACQARQMGAVKALIAGSDCSLVEEVKQMVGQQRNQSNGHPGSTISLDAVKIVGLSSAAYRKQQSIRLHNKMVQSGCTRSRALTQQAAADLLQRLATRLLQVTFKDGRRCVITGDFADGWCAGYEAADIHWTVISDGREYHLQDNCRCNGTDGYLPVVHGSVHVGPLLGTQAPVTAPASGVRPRQTTRYAARCCSRICEGRNKTWQDFSGETVHLLQTNRTDGMEVSFSLQEKQLLRGLSTVQGQLLTLLRLIFKRNMTEIGGVHGLTIDHANTLLLFVLASHGQKNDKIWQPSNLTQLLEESLDRMLAFLDLKNSSDVCMPHFFIPDALLYIEDASICTDSPDTKEAIRTLLRTLRSDVEKLADDFEENLRVIESEKLIFHPFTLLPLIPLPLVPLSLPHGSNAETAMLSIYILVHQCLEYLMQPSEATMSLPYESNWCQSAVLCLKAMQHLKLDRKDDAVRVLQQLTSHRVQRAWKEADLRPFIKRYANYTDFVWEWPLSNSFDWAWRFCFPCQGRPSLPFLPGFTQSLFTARLSQLRSSHFYVNFRCLTWSLQAELLGYRPTGAWLDELRSEDPDFEELLTLAHYSDRREELEFCVERMQEIRDKGRFAMETVDKERLDWVKEKLSKLA